MQLNIAVSKRSAWYIFHNFSPDSVGLVSVVNKLISIKRKGFFEIILSEKMGAVTHLISSTNFSFIDSAKN